MDDEHPFENDLFRILSRDMLFLEEKNHSSTILTFPHLKRLDVQYAHHDYVELFVLKTNCYLPRLSILRIRDQSIRKLQDRFNNDSSYFNINDIFRMNLLQKTR